MKKQMLLKKRLLTSAFVLSPLVLIQSAQSAVTVFFEQNGNDVRISWDGQLALSGASDFTPGTDSGTGVSNSRNLSVVVGYRFDAVGIGSMTTLSNVDGVREDGGPGNTSTGSWGFTGAELFWDGAVVGEGSVEAPTRLDYDPKAQFFVLQNRTLASVGADNFNNTLAWTANGTSDTISYITVVPEPSSAILLSLAGASFFIRRRR